MTTRRTILLAATMSFASATAAKAGLAIDRKDHSGLSALMFSAGVDQAPFEDDLGGVLSQGLVEALKSAPTFVDLLVQTSKQTYRLSGQKQTPAVEVQALLDNPRVRLSGKRVALLIEADQPMLSPLTFKTAPDIARLKEGFGGLGYRVEHMKNLDSAALLGALTAFERSLRPDDALIVFFAGLAAIEGGERWLYLNSATAPAQAPAQAPAPVRPPRGLSREPNKIPLRRLTEGFSNVSKIVFIDGLMPDRTATSR